MAGTLLGFVANFAQEVLQRQLSLSVEGIRRPTRNGSAVLRIIALDGRFIGRTPVDGDLLRHAVAADRLRQEPLGSWLVTFLCKEKSMVWPVLSTARYR